MNFPFESDNVRDNRAVGDVEIVGADKIAKLSAETSLDRAPAASRASVRPTWACTCGVPLIVRSASPLNNFGTLLIGSIPNVNRKLGSKDW